MATDIKSLEQIIATEQDRVQSIQDGIIEGILEGAREGASQGIKKAARDAFKDFLTGDLEGVSDIDFGKILEEVSQNAVRTTVRESAKNVFRGPAEIYVRSVCDRILRELQQRNARLNEDETSHLTTFIRQAHQRALKNIADKLPDNPFIKDLFEGLKAALEGALDRELTSFEERLKQA